MTSDRARGRFGSHLHMKEQVKGQVYALCHETLTQVNNREFFCEDAKILFQKSVREPGEHVVRGISHDTAITSFQAMDKRHGN